MKKRYSLLIIFSVFMIGSTPNKEYTSVISSELETQMRINDHLLERIASLENQLRKKDEEYAMFAFHPILEEIEVTSGFGMRWGKLHRGLDLRANEGTFIYAPEDGEISDPMWDSVSGHYCHIITNTHVHKFMHLKQPVIPGKVEKGQIFAISGNTGVRNTAPHVHWEVWTKDKQYLNPLIYVKHWKNDFFRSSHLGSVCSDSLSDQTRQNG